MTPDEQTEELCRLAKISPDIIEGFKCYELIDRHGIPDGTEKLTADFDTYDAIIPLIQKQDATIRTRIAVALSTGQNGVARCFDYMMKTPADLRQALLKATNRWKTDE